MSIALWSQPPSVFGGLVSALTSLVSGLPQDATRYCHGKSSICLTLRYHGHFVWNISKIISWLIIPGCSLSADPNIADLLQEDHSEIPAGGIGVGQSR